MALWTTQAFLKTADYLYARFPQPVPTINRLMQCRLISHRGEHDNRKVYENTIPAFERVEKAGIWGIELDIRWTKDLYPVVFHDRDFERVFGSDQQVCRMSLTEIKAAFTLVPTLAEVVKRFGKSMHLMIEIKREVYSDPEHQNRLLQDILSPLVPKSDYHLLSQHPEMFDLFDFVSSDTCLPVAELNVHQLSRLAIQRKLRGLTGHFLLVTDKVIQNHRKNGQAVGTGFVDSKRCLFRELNRGVRWVFSNNSLEMQKVLKQEIEKRIG